MREKPRLADAAIVAALEAHYGLAGAAPAFLPLGNDTASSVYRVEAEGATYLLKVRAGTGFSVPSLAVPHDLHRRGVPHILAPLTTLSGDLWVSVGDFALSLYPFLTTRQGAQGGLSAAQWRELGATMRQVHASELPPELAPIVAREAFIPSRRELIEALEAVVARPHPAGTPEGELAAFWQARRDLIRRVVDRCDALARGLRQAALPRVLCHADLHTWNVLVEPAGALWVIDWDETILAPKERDLMFVIGGIGPRLVGPQDTASFLQGYGETAVDPTALTYYRYAWAVQDMAAYAEQVYLLPERGEETRREGASGFMDMFEPGQMIDIALGSDGTTA